ncbi:MAG: hypothetical protein LBH86_01860 [Oscillospiraceae bacterium]|nr:hypothetical protein [Oscillospiraceae bacterium]
MRLYNDARERVGAFDIFDFGFYGDNDQQQTTADDWGIFPIIEERNNAEHGVAKNKMSEV